MKHTVFAIILSFFAVIKVLADVVGFEKLSAVSAVTNVAPAMKVFTAHKGYETYSSIFEISVTYTDKQNLSTRLNPKNYSGLQGPYNRRNVYGALIAYGPILVSNPKTKAMWNTMAFNAFCRDKSVLLELGLTNESGVEAATIRYLAQGNTDDTYPTQLDISCE